MRVFNIYYRNCEWKVVFRSRQAVSLHANLSRIANLTKVLEAASRLDRQIIVPFNVLAPMSVIIIIIKVKSTRRIALECRLIHVHYKLTFFQVPNCLLTYWNGTHCGGATDTFIFGWRFVIVNRNKAFSFQCPPATTNFSHEYANTKTVKGLLSLIW